MRFIDHILHEGSLPAPAYARKKEERIDGIPFGELDKFLRAQFGEEVPTDADEEWDGLSGDKFREAVTEYLTSNPEKAREGLRALRAEQREADKDLEGRLKDLHNALVRMLSHVAVVMVDNVYQTMLGDDQDVYDLPCYAPKWPLLWLEYKQNNGQIVGIYAQEERRPSEDEPFVPLLDQVAAGELGHMPAIGKNGFTAAKDNLWYSDNLPNREAWEQIWWVVSVDVFVRKEGLNVGPLSTWTLALNERGRLIDLIWGKHETVPPEESVNFIKIYGQAMSLMNCRNVQTVYTEPAEGLQRKHRVKRRAKHPLKGVHHIKVSPEGPERATRSRGSGDDLTEFHIQPGSFAHYGACCDNHAPKGLLFGKYTCICWRPAHVKGNPRHGIRVAEYEL